MTDDQKNEPVVILLEKISVAGALSEGDVAYFDAPGMDGKIYRFIFPPEMLTPIHDAFSQIQRKVNEVRKQHGKAEGFQRTIVKKVSSWQFGEDSDANVVLIRTQFQDGTHQDTAIPMDRIAETVKFLRQALQRFQAS